MNAATFRISNVEFSRNFEGLGVDAIEFDLTTEKGSARLLEWVNDGRVERTNSHLRINQSDDVEALFDLTNKPSLMPGWDYIDTKQIFEALQAELNVIICCEE